MSASDTDSSSSLQAQTYYTLLGIEESAQAGEVRKAYLRKAAECHPDKHPEDETATERFQALVEAYECLKDPDARREYDLKLIQIRQEPIQPDPSYPDFDPTSSHFFPQPNYAQSQAGSWSRCPPPPHAFFRATGFSPLPLFTRSFRHGGGGMPLYAAMEMFAELMASLPGPMGGNMGIRPGLGMFDIPFGSEAKFPGHPPNPFGPFDPFDHPFFHHPFGIPGPFPPHPQPHFQHRQRHLPHPPPLRRHHQPGPYPIPPAHQALIGARRSTPIPILPPMGGPMPSGRPVGPGMPRRQQASFVIKDPTGRPMGFVQHSSMSWSSGMM